MNIMNLYVYENRSMSNDLSKPLMLENLNVDNVQIHIPKEIDGTDMGTWAWWFVYQNAKREKYSIPMTLEGVTNDEGEEEYISTVGLNHGFTGKHGTVMYAIEAVQADGSGAVTHEWHTRTYKLEIVHTLHGNQTEYSETESDIISALISRVNELITSGAEIAEIAETIEHAAETAQEVIDSIPADYSELSAQVDTNAEDIDKLKADLGELATLESYNPVVDLKDYSVTQGYLNTSDGSFTATSGAGSYQQTTDPITLEKNKQYTVTFSGHSGSTAVQNPRAVCIYKSDGTYSRAVPIPSGLTSITLTGNESYLRINYNAQTVDVFTYNPTGQTEPIKTVMFNEDAIIPQLEPLESDIASLGIKVIALESGKDSYIGARRCVVAFIIDGEYDRNAEMENAFFSKGIKIGFAPQYTTAFPNNSKETYLAWQAKGHEILAHSSYTLKDGDYDDAVAKGYIKSAYTTLKGCGFKIYGFIGSSGKIADKYIPTVKRYFRYCASENNHSGSYTGTGAEPCLYFGTNAPFHLWRYSMQTSTLQQMKDAVDRAIDTTGLLLFYGHAQSANVDNFTVENVSALLDYIASKAPDISIMTPSEAVNEFYTIRYDDVVTS